MNNSVRTTITLPSTLYKVLKDRAFSQNKSVSELITDNLNQEYKIQDVKPGDGIKALIGSVNKYGNGDKKYVFNRKKFYEEIFKQRGLI